ncbi:MAG: hypothetical protein AB7H88_21595 [Vicinamibacterales bacterium]
MSPYPLGTSTRPSITTLRHLPSGEVVTKGPRGRITVSVTLRALAHTIDRLRADDEHTPRTP